MRFLEDIWLAQNRSPLWFLNSLHVLSCCKMICVCDSGTPLCCRCVNMCAKISTEAFPSFFVSGADTATIQQWPCAMHPVTCILTRCMLEKSLPFKMRDRGKSHLDWSIPSQIMQMVWPCNRDIPRDSQYSMRSEYWARRCWWKRRSWALRAPRWWPRPRIMVWCFTQIWQIECCPSWRIRRNGNSDSHTSGTKCLIENSEPWNSEIILEPNFAEPWNSEIILEPSLDLEPFMKAFGTWWNLGAAELWNRQRVERRVNLVIRDLEPISISDAQNSRDWNPIIHSGTST